MHKRLISRLLIYKIYRFLQI